METFAATFGKSTARFRRFPGGWQPDLPKDHLAVDLAQSFATATASKQTQWNSPSDWICSATDRSAVISSLTAEHAA